MSATLEIPSLSDFFFSGENRCLPEPHLQIAQRASHHGRRGAPTRAVEQGAVRQGQPHPRGSIRITQLPARMGQPQHGAREIPRSVARAVGGVPTSDPPRLRPASRTPLNTPRRHPHRRLSLWMRLPTRRRPTPSRLPRRRASPDPRSSSRRRAIGSRSKKARRSRTPARTTTTTRTRMRSLRSSTRASNPTRRRAASRRSPPPPHPPPPTTTLSSTFSSAK